MKEFAVMGSLGLVGLQCKRSLTTKFVMLPWDCLVAWDQRRYLWRFEGRRLRRSRRFSARRDRMSVYML